ncbi:MAG: YggT family protein [Fusobacteriaceae bacterium]|jgi:YggT family protein|nr:YggT family protein [Fusobacteriaceae bacterium]
MRSSYILYQIITKAGRIIDIILLIRCIFSWLPWSFRNSALGRIVYTITEPFLAPIRRWLPNMGIDFSPLILMFVVGLIQRVLIRLIFL